MRIVALLAVRNEVRYLARCLQHLHEQGVETCLIDHGSEDDTLAIAETFRQAGVFRIEHLPFQGVFSLEEQLRHKELLAAEIDADWFIHQDADEIRQAPPPFATLQEGIAAADRAGWNAIDFDEFVFVPTSDDESYEGRDYVAEMRHYYYYEPESPDRFRINAWKKQPQIDLHTHAGHQVLFPGRRVSPQPFILRHYILLSRAHAAAKYGSRQFAAEERARAWHSDRVQVGSGIRWPDRSRLHQLETGYPEHFQQELEKSQPWRRHFWLGDPGPTPATAGGAAALPGRPADAARQRRLAVLVAFRDSQNGAVPAVPPVSAAERPFWSVMIPTFNPQPQHLAEMLAGLLVQDPGAGAMQVEVVDDASTEIDVEALVAAHGSGRIRFHRQAANVGLVANWNTCVQRSQGAWVHLLHQDDRVLSGFYRRLRSPCETLPGLVAAFCRGAGFDAQGEIVWVQEPERDSAGVLHDLPARLAVEQRILTPAIVISRRAYEDIGGYHLRLPYCADWDMYKRLSVLGPIWYEPAALACWRQHEGSASARLRSVGADLVDRRRSIELSRSYLPATEAGASMVALRGSLVWAADILRDSLTSGDFTTALAQSREITRTLEELSGPEAIPAQGEPPPHAAERSQLWAEIDRLQSQVDAWMKAAQQLAGQHQNGADPVGFDRR